MEEVVYITTDMQRKLVKILWRVYNVFPIMFTLVFDAKMKFNACIYYINPTVQ